MLGVPSAGAHKGESPEPEADGYVDDNGKFHPIRGSRGYDRAKSGDAVREKVAAFNRAKRAARKR